MNDQNTFSEDKMDKGGENGIASAPPFELPDSQVSHKKVISRF